MSSFVLSFSFMESQSFLCLLIHAGNFQIIDFAKFHIHHLAWKLIIGGVGDETEKLKTLVNEQQTKMLDTIQNNTANIIKIEDELNLMQATRLNMSQQEFENRINNDWWLTTSESIENNVADEIVNMKCMFQTTALSNLKSQFTVR